MSVDKNELAQLYQIFTEFDKLKEILPKDNSLQQVLDEVLKLRADVEKLKANQPEQTNE